MLRRWFCIVPVALLVAACGTEADGSYSPPTPTYGSDLSKVSCEGLTVIAQRYTSIGDGAARMANSASSAAGYAIALQATQAYSEASRYQDEYLRRC
ncbi:MAG TPA: hypothetical protein VFJ82_21025 [Longimicrobium sp.]|nr:hypothetical protein [Longimicrobium sp.]